MGWRRILNRPGVIGRVAILNMGAIVFLALLLRSLPRSSPPLWAQYVERGLTVIFEILIFPIGTLMDHLYQGGIHFNPEYWWMPVWYVPVNAYLWSGVWHSIRESCKRSPGDTAPP